MDQAASTSGLYTLSVTKVCALPVPLPGQAEQDEIVAQVEERLSVIAAATTEIDQSLLRASRLRQSILKQAFEGKLVPQDPQDEPAAALLARIRNKQDDEAVVPTGAATQAEPRKEPKGIIFKRGAVVSYIVRALSSRPTFGRTQLEKVLHLTQSHLQVDLALQFVRDRAGPFDDVIYKLEGFANKRGWFTGKKRPTHGVTYHPGPNIEERCTAAVAILGDKRTALDRLLDHFAKMDTEKAELFATIYAAWNDLLIDGRPTDNDSIVQEVHGWHESKRRFKVDRIHTWIEWMKTHDYVPTGTGQRTQARTPGDRAGKRGSKRRPGSLDKVINT